MQQLSIPACYFPSTTLFVDDNRDFLLNFVLQLDESVAYRIFDEPIRALDYVNNKRCELGVLQNHRCLQAYADARTQSAVGQNLDLDLAAIHSEVYNPNRFAEVSVVVIDYAMPSMNGLEFCRQIENSNVKKILLTGQADEKLAVEAFNEGLIHRYIKKNDVHATDRIMKSIHELQGDYFHLMSDAIERLLPISKPSCLQDENYIRFFQQFIKHNRITEYYLADHSGSYFLLDDDANVSFLIVKNEEEMNRCYNWALEQGVQERVLEQLKTREKIPNVWHSSTSTTSVIDWDKNLFPASRFTANDTYYYSHIRSNDWMNIRQPKILSYQRYLEELDAEELLIS